MAFIFASAYRERAKDPSRSLEARKRDAVTSLRYLLAADPCENLSDQVCRDVLRLGREVLPILELDD
jgi:hypothetical protein